MSWVLFSLSLYGSRGSAPLKGFSLASGVVALFEGALLFLVGLPRFAVSVPVSWLFTPKTVLPCHCFPLSRTKLLEKVDEGTLDSVWRGFVFGGFCVDEINFVIRVVLLIRTVFAVGFTRIVVIVFDVSAVEFVDDHVDAVILHWFPFDAMCIKGFRSSTVISGFEGSGNVAAFSTLSTSVTSWLRSSAILADFSGDIGCIAGVGFPLFDGLGVLLKGVSSDFWVKSLSEVVAKGSLIGESCF